MAAGPPVVPELMMTPMMTADLVMSNACVVPSVERSPVMTAEAVKPEPVTAFDPVAQPRKPHALEMDSSVAPGSGVSKAPNR